MTDPASPQGARRGLNGRTDLAWTVAQATLGMRRTVAGALQRISIWVRPSFVTGTQRIVRQAGPVTVVATFFMGVSS